MKIDFQGIKHASQLSPHSAKSLWHKLTRDPYVDWAIIITIACILGLFVIGMGVFDYMNVTSALNGPSNAKPTKVEGIFDKSKLQEFLDQTNIEATEYEDLLKTYSKSGDPAR